MSVSPREELQGWTTPRPLRSPAAVRLTPARGVCPRLPAGPLLSRWAGRGSDRPLRGGHLWAGQTLLFLVPGRQSETVRGRGNLTHLGRHRRFFQNSTETSVERLFRIVALRVSPSSVSGQASAPSRPALGPLTGRGREPGLSSPGDSFCGPRSHSPPGARRGQRCHPAGARVASVARAAACAAKPSPAHRAHSRGPRAASPRLSQFSSDLCARQLSLPGCQFLAQAES